MRYILPSASTDIEGPVSLVDSITSTSLTTAATPNSVNTLRNLALLEEGGILTGELLVGATGSLMFDGASPGGFVTRLVVDDPTNNRDITLPNRSGTVITTGDTGTVTSTMIAEGTIVNSDINASAAISGTKINPDFGSQNVVTTGNVSLSGTGFLDLPVGTTAERPGSPNSGMIRYNSTLGYFEGYGITWGKIGGGATGGDSDDVFYENGQTVTTSYSISAGKNAVSAGPITINSGVVVTIPSGQAWVIV